MVVELCNPSTHKEEPEFEASLGYVARVCLSKKKKKNTSKGLFPYENLS
jgi:hypothetical protein